jgi:hypothetical protein
VFFCGGQSAHFNFHRSRPVRHTYQLWLRIRIHAQHLGGIRTAEPFPVGLRWDTDGRRRSAFAPSPHPHNCRRPVRLRSAYRALGRGQALFCCAAIRRSVGLPQSAHDLRGPDHSPEIPRGLGTSSSTCRNSGRNLARGSNAAAGADPTQQPITLQLEKVEYQIKEAANWGGLKGKKRPRSNPCVMDAGPILAASIE